MPAPRSNAAQLALATLLFCALVALSPLAKAQTGGYRIAGKVVSSTSGAPLSQARVTIASVQDRDETKSLITGDDGTFAFTNLAAGKYSLSAARRGFIESSFEQHENFSTAIVTGGDADSEHLVFRLTPQAVLTGHVLDEVGDPVRRATVALYRQDQSTGVSLVHRVGGARTDDLGSYEFSDLRAGTYFLSVNAKPWYALHPRSMPSPDGTVTVTPPEHSFDVAYATTYYPDATDSDEATPIPLRGGERLSVDMHLSPVQALSILIRRTGAPGQGFAFPQIERKSFDSTENVTAQIMSHSSESFGGPENFQMLSQGLVELSGIPAGKYTLHTPGIPGSESSGSITEVDLNQNGQEVNPASGEPVSNAKFSVRVLGQAQVPQQLLLALRDAGHKVVRTAPVDPQGEAELADIPPGKYALLAATPVNDYAVMRITINGSPSNGHSMDIVSGMTIEGTVTLIGGQTIVRGFAKRSGKGAAGAMVVLVPKEPEANAELFRRDQSDSDGSFSLNTVIPGEYTIVAIENGWDLNWSQPGVIAHYLPQGRKIVVPSTAQEPVRLSEPVEVQPR